MASMAALGLMLVATMLTSANALGADTTDEAYFSRSREEQESDYRTTVVVINGIIVPTILIGFPLSVVALSRTKLGRQASRWLMRHRSGSRRRILSPLAPPHEPAISRGPFGLVATSYRKNPVGTLGWLALVVALCALPGAIWLSMLRF